MLRTMPRLITFSIFMLVSLIFGKTINASELDITITAAGTGMVAEVGMRVKVHYTGTLLDLSLIHI